MATDKKPNSHTVTKDPEKSVDVPPYGSRNPDPLTDQPGSHPVETGLGAVIGGIASGMAVGAMVSGPAAPVGAVIGAIVGGAAAGGLAGKGIGELIDPTTEDNWLREYHAKADTDTYPAAKGYTAEDYRPAYRYGLSSAASDAYTGRRYEDIEPELRTRYESDTTAKSLPWDDVRGAVKDAYDRTCRLHAERAGSQVNLPAGQSQVVAGRTTTGKAKM